MTFQKLEAFNRLWEKTPPPAISLARISNVLNQIFAVEDATKTPPPPDAFVMPPEFEE